MAFRLDDALNFLFQDARFEIVDRHDEVVVVVEFGISASFFEVFLSAWFDRWNAQTVEGIGHFVVDVARLIFESRSGRIFFEPSDMLIKLCMDEFIDELFARAVVALGKG